MLLILCCVPVNLLKLGELAFTPSSIWLSTGFSRAAVKIKRGRWVRIAALTSAPSCVCLQSCVPVSPNAWGRTGTWSCNLRDASRDRNRRSQLEDRRETEVKNMRNRRDEGPRGSGIYSCSFMPGCTCWDEPGAADVSLQGGADQAAHL